MAKIFHIVFLTTIVFLITIITASRYFKNYRLSLSLQYLLCVNVNICNKMLKRVY